MPSIQKKDYICTVIQTSKITSMKKLLLFFVATLLLTACDPTEPVNPNNGKGKLDPTAMVKIKGVPNVARINQKAQITGLTPLEVVQQGINIKWQSHWFDNEYYETPYNIGRGFGDGMRDFETPALLMFGTDIITQQGDFYKDFIYGFNVVITKTGGDTIACVPDSVINKARPLIEAAYNDSNYTECYRLFNEVFTFIPLR